MARPHLGMSLDMYNNLFGPLNTVYFFHLNRIGSFPYRSAHLRGIVGVMAEMLLTQAHLGQHLPRPARVPEEGR